jgi:hypothetical protein
MTSHDFITSTVMMSSSLYQSLSGPLPEEMPPLLGNTDYDLESADGSHLADCHLPNEKEE